MNNEMKFAEWLSENHYVLIDIDKFGNRIWKNETKKLDTKLLYRKFKNETMKDSIVESVIEQFKQRSNVGINKYGTTLDREDLTMLEWLKHLQEELMDATLYVEKIKSKLGFVISNYNEELEQRMNIIGQNGNEGTHYDTK
jgi:hypothetical protein